MLLRYCCCCCYRLLLLLLLAAAATGCCAAASAGDDGDDGDRDVRQRKEAGLSRARYVSSHYGGYNTNTKVMTKCFVIHDHHEMDILQFRHTQLNWMFY